MIKGTIQTHPEKGWIEARFESSARTDGEFQEDLISIGPADNVLKHVAQYLGSDIVQFNDWEKDYLALKINADLIKYLEYQFKGQLDDREQAIMLNIKGLLEKLKA